jgi:hypothetical protein
VTFDIGAYSAGSVSANIGGTAVLLTATTVSAESEKKNFHEDADDLDLILNDPTLSFDYTAEAQARYHAPPHVRHGVTVEEIERDFPEAIYKRPGQADQIDLSKLILPLWNGERSIVERQAAINARDEKIIRSMGAIIGAGFAYILFRLVTLHRRTRPLIPPKPSIPPKPATPPLQS